MTETMDSGEHVYRKVGEAICRRICARSEPLLLLKVGLLPVAAHNLPVQHL